MDARPFYLIAHMCNEPDRVANAVGAGANAIECDIDWDPGNPTKPPYVHHPWPPSDLAYTGSTGLSDWLDTVEQSVAKGLSLVLFDCKVPEMRFKAIYEPVHQALHAPHTGPPTVVFTVDSLKSARTFFDGADLRVLDAWEGVGIDSENSPGEVAQFFRDRGATNHCYANGVSLLYTQILFPNVRPSLTQAVADRATFGSRLIYAWTVNDQDRWEDYLRIGVDGIMLDAFTTHVGGPDTISDNLKNLQTLLAASNAVERINTPVRIPGPSEPVLGQTHLPAYRVTVKTSNRAWAGTNANVRVTLRNGDRTSGQLLLDTVGVDDFERGSRRPYVVTGVDVGGAVDSVVLEQDGTGLSPDWAVESVEVSSPGSPPVSFWPPEDPWVRKGTPVVLRTRPADATADPWLLATTDASTGFPWGAGTAMARRDIPWDAGCAVTPMVDGLSALTAIRNAFLTVAGATGIANRRVYICGWQFNALRDLSTDNLKNFGTASPGTLRDDTLIAWLLRLMRAGVTVRVLLWQPLPIATLADKLFAANVADHRFVARVVREESANLQQIAGKPAGVVGLDARISRGTGAHHQKMVLVRGEGADIDVAFVGGIDLAFTRRDTCAEGVVGDWQSGTDIPVLGPPAKGEQPWWPIESNFNYDSVKATTVERVQPPPNLDVSWYGEHYQRWHDHCLQLRGPVVATLEQQFRERWVDTGRASELRTAIEVGEVQFTHVAAITTTRDGATVADPTFLDPPKEAASMLGATAKVQMWRTIPVRSKRNERWATLADGRDGQKVTLFRHGEFTVARGMAQAIMASQQLILVVDQYLWSEAYARAVNQRMRAVPSLHAIVIVPPHCVDGAIAGLAHEATYRALRALTDAVGDRVLVLDTWDPQDPTGQQQPLKGVGIYTHAKTQTYDDQLLVCGSANLNVRSLLNDTELVCAVHDQQAVRTYWTKLMSLLLSNTDTTWIPATSSSTWGKDFFEGVRGALAQKTPRLVITDPWQQDPAVLPLGNRSRSAQLHWLGIEIADPTSVRRAGDPYKDVSLDELAARLARLSGAR